jgi:hypothetical protein
MAPPCVGPRGYHMLCRIEALRNAHAAAKHSHSIDGCTQSAVLPQSSPSASRAPSAEESETLTGGPQHLFDLPSTSEYVPQNMKFKLQTLYHLIGDVLLCDWDHMRDVSLGTKPRFRGLSQGKSGFCGHCVHRQRVQI